jgi:hypothetical protein
MLRRIWQRLFGNKASPSKERTNDMSFWKKLFGGGDVTFLREEARMVQGLATTPALATYRYYKAPSKEAALSFLNKQKISKRMLYVCVESPDGKWLKDCDGTFDNYGFRV